MPITIRPSVVKIKKPSTGEYREINALLDTDSAKTVYYGVSSTAADTQTKAVAIEGITELSDGLLVRVLFANAQSYSGTPKLQINSTIASNIKWTTGADAETLTWEAGEVLDFVYVSSASGFVVLDRKAIADEATARANADAALQTAIAPFTGTIRAASDADLMRKSCFFHAANGIALGSTGVTIEAYARGAVFSADGDTGSIMAIGYGGLVYVAFFTEAVVRNAQIYRNGSPVFTGVPTAPTAALGTNTTQLATTQFVQTALNAQKATNTTSASEFGTTSTFFSATAAIALGSTGITIPVYSKGAFISNGSADGVLFAIAPTCDTIVAFRNNGTWSRAYNVVTNNVSSISVTLSNKAVPATIYKQGKMCFITSSEDFTSVASGFTVIGTITDAAYRPSKTVRTAITNFAGTWLYFVQITTGGEISLYSGQAQSGAYNGTFWAAYFTN